MRLSDTKQAKVVSPIAKHIGQKIFDRRVKLNMTQQDIRKLAKLSAAHFCDVENGKVRVGAESLYRIGKALDVGMSYFFKP